MPTPVGAVLRRTRPPRNATRAFRVDSDSHCEAIRALGVDSCDLHS